MLGIPIEGQDVNNFWVSFWASLSSGVIYSIFTGIIVGLTVWWVQRIYENRRLLQEYKRELSVLREKLRYASQQPDVLNIHSIVDSAPMPVVAIIKNLTEVPLDLWLDDYALEREFLEQLKGLQKAYSNFVVVSNNLNLKLSSFIRSYHASKGIYAVNDQAVCSFFIGRIHSVPTLNIISWLSLPEEAATRLETSYNDAISDPIINECSKTYLEARSRLIDEFKTVEKALNS